MEFTIVERKNVTEDIKDELVKKLVDLSDDEALQVKLDPGTNFVNWQSTLRNKLRKHNLRARITLDKASKTVTVYTEELAD